MWELVESRTLGGTAASPTPMSDVSSVQNSPNWLWSNQIIAAQYLTLLTIKDVARSRWLQILLYILPHEWNLEPAPTCSIFNHHLAMGKFKFCLLFETLPNNTIQTLLRLRSFSWSKNIKNSFGLIESGEFDAPSHAISTPFPPRWHVHRGVTKLWWTQGWFFLKPKETHSF